LRAFLFYKKLGLFLLALIVLIFASLRLSEKIVARKGAKTQSKNLN